MTERYTFGEHFLGLAMEHTLRLRRAGFRTRLTTTTFHGFTLHTVEATPAPRPTRAERGCTL